MILLSSIQDHALLKCRAHWVADNGEIDGGQWDMAIELVPISSLLFLHKLSQLFILCRAYQTPARLFD